MKRKTEAKSYLISALRQQRQNKNYVISRRLLQTRKWSWRRREKSYLDRCKKLDVEADVTKLFFIWRVKTRWGNHGDDLENHPANKWKPVTNFWSKGLRDERKKMFYLFFLMRRKEKHNPLFKILRLMKPENVTHTWGQVLNGTINPFSQEIAIDERLFAAKTTERKQQISGNV